MRLSTFYKNNRKKLFQTLTKGAKICYNNQDNSKRRGKNMKKCKITVMRITRYPDLMAKYENPITHACDLREGQVFVANGCIRPDGLCESAWESMFPFVKELAQGGGNFYDGWMKNERSAMISCNDGFRPVSFYIEALDEDADEQ